MREKDAYLMGCKLHTSTLIKNSGYGKKGKREVWNKMHII
jgi:hypothetical protein